ncbi:hypothetical protein SAMN04487886_105611 [Clostridium sp. DSM 8431]|uniref:hypothetical protein n=1 Tax=Clostridium sp. DSM 8431 TaxID=1761781 RepID=UPI0008F04B54|nr:hypothetical protein [Clostridium sp. DSM 8431]SFU55654.1 hypothetical protein SAMN04487886_105611 [Clostridium sp. DSM 8431]
MINNLLEISLSEEAKAIVSQSYYKKRSLEISTFIEFGGQLEAVTKIIKEIIKTVWNENFEKYIKVFDDNEMGDYQRLYIAKKEVVYSKVLFAISKAKGGCYITINHALADESTLEIIKRLVKLAYENEINSITNELIEGRLLYENYVKRQNELKKERILVKKRYENKVEPVKLSDLGRLAWSESSERIYITKVVKMNEKVTQKDMINNVIFFLKNSSEIDRGNIICSSRDWRGPDEKKAIGMMTGLVPLPLINIGEENEFCLEVSSKFNNDDYEVLNCCRNSDLFINGTIPRGIPVEQVIDCSFPVGIEIKKINKTDFKIEIEGKLKSKKGVENFICELLDFLVNNLKVNS